MFWKWVVASERLRALSTYRKAVFSIKTEEFCMFPMFNEVAAVSSAETSEEEMDSDDEESRRIMALGKQLLRLENPAIEIDPIPPLSSFGISFDSDGSVIKPENWDYVAFTDRDDFRDALAEYMGSYLETLGLEKFYVKSICDPRHYSRFGYIYASLNCWEASDVVFLLHASGRCAGMWSSRLVTDEGLTTGSIESYVREAQRLGMGIVVSNPTKTKVSVDGKRFDLLNSESPLEHLILNLEQCLCLPKMESIHIVSQENGCELLQSYFDRYCSPLVSKIKNVCLIGGELQQNKFEIPFPVVTTWSCSRFDKQSRNIFIPDRETISWPYMIIHSVFCIIRGGKMDEAQRLINSKEPYVPKQEEEDSFDDDDPFADYV